MEERLKLIEEYLQSNTLNIEDYSSLELFLIYIKVIEGYDFKNETIESWFNLIKLLIKKDKKNAIETRLDELRSGDINFDDFGNSEELADYIEWGD